MLNKLLESVTRSVRRVGQSCAQRRGGGFLGLRSGLHPALHRRAEARGPVHGSEVVQGKKKKK